MFNWNAFIQAKLAACEPSNVPVRLAGGWAMVFHRDGDGEPWLELVAPRGQRWATEGLYAPHERVRAAEGNEN